GGVSAAEEVREDAGELGGSTATAAAVTPGADAETERTGSRCLKAFTVAINQAPDTEWLYTATKELRLVSFHLCEACRNAHTVYLRVEKDIPTTLLGGVVARDESAKGGMSSRVPPFRARRAMWMLPFLSLLTNELEVWAELRMLYFPHRWKGSLDVQVRPSRLRSIRFSDASFFNQPIVDVAWPVSLMQVIFGGMFNQSLVGVKW
ncbi:unnamed protein product, partial [Scytosiphon promiscuus]